MPFKRGDTREDGLVFYNYTNKLKLNGFFQERWLTPDVSDVVKVKDKSKKREAYKRKSDRRAPGFAKLSAKTQATANRLRYIHEEQQTHKDLSIDDMAEMLIGYELETEELNLAIEHAQPLCFDARAVFNKLLSA